MRFDIYTWENNHRVLHTAYMHNEAREKYNNLVSSGKYSKVEMKISGTVIEHWER